MFTKATIIGNGGMGSVCAMLLCENGIDTTLWGYDAGELAQMAAAKENVIYLPGYPLPDTLAYEPDDVKALACPEQSRGASSLYKPRRLHNQNIDYKMRKNPPPRSPTSFFP